MNCVECYAGISLKDALCPSCGRFVISDLSEEQQRQRTAARGAGRAIVGAIALSIIGGIGWVFMMDSFSYRREAQERSAKNDVEAVLPIAQKWTMDHPGECPTLERLRADKELAPGSRIEDPWDHRYRIECNAPDVAVRSDGPDGKSGTYDDIVDRLSNYRDEADYKARERHRRHAMVVE